MKKIFTILFALLLLSFISFTGFAATNHGKAKDRCLEGVTKFNEKFNIKKDPPHIIQICDYAVHSGGKKIDTGLGFKWNFGNQFHLLLHNAELRGNEEYLAASCKVGVYIAQESSGKKNFDKSMSVVAHELCVGPLKEGDVIEKTKTNSDGKVIDQYFRKYVKGEFVKDGKHTRFDNQGNMTQDISYKNGKKDGQEIYYSNGKKIQLTTYKMDKKNGPYKHWDTKGKVDKEGQYKDDKRDGMWKYYTRGELENEGQYKDDKQDGEWKYYNGGKLNRTVKFKDGKRI